MHTDSDIQRFLGIDFANVSIERLAAELERLSRSAAFSFVVTPNVDHLVLLHDEESEIAELFRQACAAACFRLCDSRVLKILARSLGMPLEVVTGSDLTAYLFKRGKLDGKTVALIGGDAAMQEELGLRYPAVGIVQHIPPMGVLNNPDAIDKIEEFLANSQSEYALFAVGAPQSEIIALKCQSAGRSRGVALCVGASIDFLLGRKPRAPIWMQRLSLEWLFRLLSEPRRLARRYLIVAPRIFWIVWRFKRGQDFVRGKNSSGEVSDG
ncbi:WecG/TagA-family glycosyltransferase [Erythrobacter litoralis]|uniref:WecB/TagA/CpsF family glycosyltransferase n=1 Tax=Erythrobacter litoralis TaxID=39960 RepID=UPI00086392D6|nr:WecB/TagA/CpsF family glycosyltransferase [Erythrobacter litoralis]AOL22380.1 WecG/TagA-family glycosyltransferase [Erythrobacter litoralis]